MSEYNVVQGSEMTPEEFVKQMQEQRAAMVPEGWDDLSETEKFNYETASRLRGLAGMVEAANKPVRLRVGGRLKFDDGTSFESPVKDFREFSVKLALFALEKQVETANKTDSPEAATLLELYARIKVGLEQEAAKKRR